MKPRDSIRLVQAAPAMLVVCAPERNLGERAVRPSPGSSLAVRLESHIIRLPIAGCWIWTGATSHRGYGKFALTHENGRREFVGAHRVSFELHHGPIPPGMWVLHQCDVTCCVNPDHLYLGTVVENTGDTLRRRGKIGAPSYGESNGLARLDWSKVRQIRGLYPKLSQSQLGTQFGVSQSVISSVVRCKTWKEA